MSNYSEFFNADKKATVSCLEQGLMKSWVVEMYIDNRIVQKITLGDGLKAKSLAENFIRNDGQAVQTLLSEFV
jgi:hypothetical protein